MFVTQAFAQNAAPAPAGAAAHMETAPATEAGHGANVFPPFDSQYFPSQILWLAITFIAFYIFVKRTLVPQIGGILETRREKISSDLQNAARMKEEADAAIAAYEQELADARSRAGEIGQRARDEAKAAAEEERRKIEASLEGKLAEAEARIANIRASAMKDVDTVAEQTASLIVEKLTGGQPSKAEIAAAINRVRE
ncbi:MAG: F0F1 ATP synthase subunit B [Rhizobiaceae bacterium]